MCYQIFLEIEYHSKPDQDSELGAAVVFFFFFKLFINYSIQEQIVSNQIKGDKRVVGMSNPYQMQ